MTAKTLDDLTEAQLQAMLAQKEDPHVAAIHSNESNQASPTASPVNPASGATGAMQTMPRTAMDPGYGVKPSNGTPEDNNRLGVEYYQKLRDHFKDPQVAAIAYDWGPGNTEKWLKNGGDINQLPVETLDYIDKWQKKQPKQTGAAPAPAQPAAQQPNNGLDFGKGNNDWYDTPGPTTLTGQLMHQAGRLARSVGHGAANAVGFVANPLNTLSNQVAKATGDTGRLYDADTILKNLVDQNTPDPLNATETNVGEVADATANPLNYIGGGIMQPARSFLGAIGKGGITGLLAGLTGQPTHGTDTAGDVAKRALIGAATGGVVGGIGNRVAAAVAPQISPEIQALRNEGVTPTIGQSLGGAYERTEAHATSLPIVGNQIESARKAADASFNRALYARALADTPNSVVPTTAGREGVASVRDQIGSAYDETLARTNFSIDPQFQANMLNIGRQAATLPRNEREQYNNLINEHMGSQMSNTGVLDGDTIKTIQSSMRNDISDLTGAADAYQRRLGYRLQDALDAFNAAIGRQNPQEAQTLAGLDRSWAIFSRIRGAASKVTEDAPFSPAQFQTAVRSADETVGKGGFATGEALSQDIADNAKAGIGKRTPDSGTPGRLNLSHAIGGMLTGGAAAFHPYATGAAMLGGSAAYTPQGQAVLNALLTQRPDLMMQLGGGMRAISPALNGILSGDAAGQ